MSSQHSAPRHIRPQIVFAVLLGVSVVVAAPFLAKAMLGGKKPAEPDSLPPVITTTTASETTTTETPTTTTTAAPATTTAAPSTPADDTFFRDTLFIGDSRGEGLQYYGRMTGADFFVHRGLSNYNLPQTTVSIDGIGNIGLTDLLKRKQYGKVYVMIGINELGYNFDTSIRRYTEQINEIRAAQPNAKIFICANLHVTAERSAKEESFNNPKMDRFNNAIKALADNTSIFYLDINEQFDDDQGALRADMSSDGIHILGKYYAEWGAWIREKSAQY